MNDQIPDLKIELMRGEPFDRWIMLEQDSGGNMDRVSLHPTQLRYLAEIAGLVPASDLESARTIATLERRMRLLRDRIDRLGHWLTDRPESERMALAPEIAFVEATSDLADEFCADIDDRKPRQNPTETQGL